jgi:hypothetical protein
MALTNKFGGIPIVGVLSKFIRKFHFFIWAISEIATPPFRKDAEKGT